MVKYVLTNKAIEDLSNIWNYTYDNWSEKQADKYYELLILACEAISTNPQKGKNYTAIDNNIFGYNASYHIIFYRIVEHNKIEIVRILHGSMDLKNRMQDE